MVRNVSRLHLTECYTLCNGCGVQTEERSPAAWERLREAWLTSELTLAEVQAEAEKLGLRLTRSSISRKFSGKQALLADEERVLARVVRLAEAA